MVTQVDEQQYRNIATPEDIDWLMEQLGDKTLAVFNTLGTAKDIPHRTTAKITGSGAAARTILTEWVSTPNLRLFAQLDVGTLFIAPSDIVFSRTKLPAQLKQAQAKLTTTTQARQNYEEAERSAVSVVESLKAKMSEAHYGPTIDAIREQVMAWPETLDFKVGPCWDAMSRSVIPANTMVITFLPVLYNGDDINGVGPDPRKWAATNPVRLILKEDGHLTSFAGGADSFHPHLLGDRVCGGNVSGILAVMMQENSVGGALDALRVYAVSHQERDYMDKVWAGKAWNWWQQHVVLDREPWRRGNWDGKTVILSADNTPIVNIEDYFAASVENIVHVGTSGLHYVTKESIAAYVTSKDTVRKATGLCRMSGHALMACPCHAGVCSESFVKDYLCRIPAVDNFIAVPLIYHVGRATWRYVQPEELGVHCEFINPRTDRYCAKPATMHNSLGAPRWVCDEHIPAEAKEAIVEQVKTRSDLGPLATNENMRAMIRHHHEHSHPTYPGADMTFTHSHHHEHPIEDAVTPQISVHDIFHAAFRGAHTGTSVLRHRRDMQ